LAGLHDLTDDPGRDAIYVSAHGRDHAKRVGPGLVEGQAEFCGVPGQGNIIHAKGSHKIAEALRAGERDLMARFLQANRKRQEGLQVAA
jgi:hypothetical protein